MKDETRIEITTGTIARAILLVVAAIALFMLKDLVLVVLTAVVIASCAEPFIQWFIRLRIYRVFAALIVYMILAGILIGSFYTFVPRLLKDSSEFLSLVPKYLETSSLWNPLDRDIATDPQAVAMSFSIPPAETSSIKDALQGINEAISSVSAGFVHSASSVFGGVLSFILIAVLSFYLAVQEDGVEKFLRIVIPDKNEGYVVNLWKRTQAKIGLWMQGQIVLALLVGALVYLGLTLLGVRNALLFAVLAAVLETIPLFGPIIAAIPAVAVAYNDGGATSGFIVAGLYLIIHQFENHLIYPLVVKKIVGIPPILVILSLLVGAKLAGFLGIILSVPVASMLVEFLDDVEKDKKAVKSA
ncbi:MAG TPA: AI-2E family transporter [Candidatus Paceibacterota bacterium]